MFTTNEFDTGMRVELRPGTYLWEQGERTGRVIKVSPRFVYVWMEHSGETYRLAPHVLLPVVDPLKRWSRVVKLGGSSKWDRVEETLRGRRS